MRLGHTRNGLKLTIVMSVTEGPEQVRHWKTPITYTILSMITNISSFTNIPCNRVSRRLTGRRLNFLSYTEMKDKVIGGCTPHYSVWTSSMVLYFVVNFCNIFLFIYGSPDVTSNLRWDPNTIIDLTKTSIFLTFPNRNNLPFHWNFHSGVLVFTVI